MEQEIIINDINLGIMILNILKNAGQREKNDLNYKKFLLSELQTIKRLRIEDTSIADISSLKYFTNLEQLTIKSSSAKDINTNFTHEAAMNYLMKKTKIKDFSVIGELKSLTTLSIINDENLTSIDLTHLTKLYYLDLSGNSSLEEIKGIENLTELCYLRLFRSPIKSEFDLCALVNNALTDLELDFDLYPMLKRKNPIFEEVFRNLHSIGGSVKWIENYSNFDTNNISTFRMVMLNNEAENIISGIIKPEYTNIEKLCAIYAYITQTVKYDYDMQKAKKLVSCRF